MANRYSVATGNASNVATWDGGATVPVTGDRVMISAGHTVTLDGNFEWGDDASTTIVINGVSTTRSIWVVGTLKASRAVNSQLTCNGTLWIDATGSLDYGKNGDAIPSTVSAKLLLNKSAVMGSGRWGLDVQDGAGFWFWGATKKRVAKLAVAPSAGATQITVDDATGWQIGDRVVLPNDSGINADRTEIRTIAGTYGGGTVIPLTAALTYAHTNGLPVGNLDSNVYVSPLNFTYPSWAIAFDNMQSGAKYREIRYATFEQLTSYTFSYSDGSPNTGAGGFSCGLILTSPSTAKKDPYVSVGDIACIDTLGVFNTGQPAVFGKNRRCHLPSTEVNTPVERSVLLSLQACILEFSDTTFNSVLLCGLYPQLGLGAESGTFNDCWFAGRLTGNPAWLPTSSTGEKFNRCYFFGAMYAALFGDGYLGAECVECDFGFTFPLPNVVVLRPRSSNVVAQATLRDCKFGTNINIIDTDWYGEPSSSLPAPHADNYGRVVNKNQDPSIQEEYLAVGSIKRDNAVNYSGTNPSWQFAPRSTVKPLKKTLKVLAPYNGANPTLTVVSGRIKRDAGIGAVSVTLKGLGITPSVYNCVAAAGVWEQFIVFGTQTQGGSGVLDVECSVLLAGGGTAGTDKCWIAEVSAPLAVAANTGSFQFWADAQPVQLMMSNAVGALDVMNVLISQLTLPNSVGKAIAEMFRVHGLELGTPLVVSPTQRSAGAGIVQTINEGAQVTVTRQ